MFSDFIILTILFAAALSPLLLAFFGSNRKNRARLALLLNICSVFAVCVFITAFSFGTHALAAGAETAAAAAQSAGSSAGLAYIGAAIVTGASCIGGGIAVASSASAALGAVSENESLFGKAIIFVVLAEGIAIYGMLISLLILGKV